MKDYDKIQRIFSYTGLNASSLAKELKLKSPQAFYDIKAGKHGISRDLAKAIQDKYQNLSRVWLLTGEGEMLISTDDKGNLIANNGAVAISGDKATVHLSSSNSSTEIQLLQQRIKHLEELLAEKERIIQILERITSPQ